MEVSRNAETVQQIKRELKTAKHCAIYDEELGRVWPDDRIAMRSI